jgi:hypothetical protein
MTAERRYRAEVRATRAYLAGFGTSGSLLAGAAVLFVLASAIVAFRGWPQVAAQPATGAVAASAPAGGTSSRDARRLTRAIGARATAVSTVARLTPGRGHSLRTGTGRTGTPSTGVGSVPAAGPSGSTTATSPTNGSPVQAVIGSAPTGGCPTGSCSVTTTPTNLISNAANTATQAANNAGSAVGSAVSGATGTGTGTGSGTTPVPAPVQSTATNAVNTASGTLTTATNALPGQ